MSISLQGQSLQMKHLWFKEETCLCRRIPDGSSSWSKGIIPVWPHSAYAQWKRKLWKWKGPSTKESILFTCAFNPVLPWLTVQRQMMKDASKDALHRWIPSRADRYPCPWVQGLSSTTDHAECHFPVNDLGKHPVMQSENNRHFAATGDIDCSHFLSSMGKLVLG